ncbi:hypothetical protein SAMN04488103_110143 [Gemmobacter aquatilis]|uniref:Uncharacterized protein n=1 Tax=Gemmobacter aquatilis TaxID=933059 RepID=A0A1H8L8S0_9RHOB|nr:hypothetical protein SAMN04488103_110143 [Gemmobacter aquatilis]
MQTERRHNLGKIEAARHNVRGKLGTRTRQWIASDRFEEGKAVVSRLTGAAARAFFVMVMIITPSVLLPGTGADGKEMVALVALFAGALTFTEYKTTYPGLVEFRDAPPFNRMRFLILFFTVFLLAVIEKNELAPTSLTRLISAIGLLIGNALDFPYSPVRLATLMMTQGSDGAQVAAVRTAAGVAYLVSALGLAYFVVLLKMNSWPSRNGVFNVWINLPTFDPTTGGDVVARLERDARINIAFGFLLPFLIPAVVKIGASGFEPLTLTAPQTLIWVLTAWSFLPCSLFMRGIAMGKIAEMIREQRKLSSAMPRSGFQPA